MDLQLSRNWEITFFCVLHSAFSGCWGTKRKKFLVNLKKEFYVGDYSGRGTPVPISNTEVKPTKADGT